MPSRILPSPLEVTVRMAFALATVFSIEAGAWAADASTTVAFLSLRSETLGQLGVISKAFRRSGLASRIVALIYQR